jgi:hypothetical protein
MIALRRELSIVVVLEEEVEAPSELDTPLRVAMLKDMTTFFAIEAATGSLLW